MRSSFTTQGFILKKSNRSEADRVFTLFTKDLGKITAIGKGVRRLGSKKRGHLEVFSKIKVSISQSGDFYYISEATTLDNYIANKRSLNKVSLGYYFLELVDKLTQLNEADLKLYSLLEKYLSLLSDFENLKKLRSSFVKDVLIALGYWRDEFKILNVDNLVSDVVEKNINSLRVGKRILSS